MDNIIASDKVYSCDVNLLPLTSLVVKVGNFRH